MKKIRINVLARELEVKSHTILELLPEMGVTEKLTHSSSIDEDVADKLRVHFGLEPIGNGAAPEAPQAPAVVAEPPVTLPEKSAAPAPEPPPPAPKPEAPEPEPVVPEPAPKPSSPIRPPIAAHA